MTATCAGIDTSELPPFTVVARESRSLRVLDFAAIINTSNDTETKLLRREGLIVPSFYRCHAYAPLPRCLGKVCSMHVEKTPM